MLWAFPRSRRKQPNCRPLSSTCPTTTSISQTLSMLLLPQLLQVWIPLACPGPPAATGWVLHRLQAHGVLLCLQLCTLLADVGLVAVHLLVLGLVHLRVDTAQHSTRSVHVLTHTRGSDNPIQTQQTERKACTAN